MQIVSRKDFFKIIGKSGISENDFSDINNKLKEVQYDKFLKAYQISNKKAIAQFEAGETGDLSDDIAEITFNILKKEWIEKFSPPLKYVSKGSSRTAFLCPNGQCLKIAHDQKGVGQNETEVVNTFKEDIRAGYPIFTQIYDYDKKGYGSILTEFCSKEATEQDFRNLFGIKYMERFSEILEEIFDENSFYDYNGFDREKYLLETYEEKLESGNVSSDYAKTIKGKIDFLNNYINSDYAQWKVLRSLKQFYLDNHLDDLNIIDLGLVENWGLAVRYNKPCLVILDAGFSTEIKNMFY